MTGPPGPPFPQNPPGSNLIGKSFKVGVSTIGTIPPFYYWNTVLAQYANSPIITGLIGDFFQYIDKTEAFDDFYDAIMNIDTAFGYGLDVWGRIVGVSRTLNVGAGTYFGFNQGQPGTQPWNQGTWFSGNALTTNFVLADGPYRVLIFAKALANISDGSIPSINHILTSLFPGRGQAYCTDGLNMTMTYTFKFPLTPVELAIVGQSGALPRPAGVAATVVQI